MPKTPKTPFDKVREAFAELDASEKTAFVLEATFAAVGEGLAETGRRFSDAVQDIDDLFTADHRKADASEEPPVGEPAPAGTTPGATAGGPRKKPTSTPKSSASKPSSKTAGKTGRKPKSDDDA